MILRQWLWTHRKSVSAAAREIGIHRGYLCNINNGRVTPSKKTALLIEQYTKGDVSAMELIFPERYLKGEV